MENKNKLNGFIYPSESTQGDGINITYNEFGDVINIEITK